jgi:N-acetyl-anhydromuramyl-L-alanine amidase AmpD
MKFIEAANFTLRASARPVDLIVLHSMESQEKPDTAESVAAWFASEKAPQASAHFCVDANSIVQCVRVQDIAWHAPGANANGIGIEHAGRAAQTREQWLDNYSLPMLELSARLVAALCRAHNVPAIYQPWPALQHGARGITTHNDVSLAFHKSTHTDPGKGFPMDFYLGRVVLYLGYADPLAGLGPIL